jgi:hypothetical protein
MGSVGTAQALGARASDEMALINRALQGPVVDILIKQIPELGHFGRDSVFDMVMADPLLGDGCFRLFRRRPDLFSAVLGAPNGALVQDDSAVLPCGRTLANVVTLIVRNMARRYFRVRLDGVVEKPRVRSKPKESLVDEWLRTMQELWRQPQPMKASAPVRRRSDQLYEVIRDYLLFDWQVKLFPHYANLPPATVGSVGAQLLHCREPEAIYDLVRNGKVVPKAITPEAALLTPSGAMPVEFIDPPDLMARIDKVSNPDRPVG